MFVHGCFLPALGAEGVVPISGTTWTGKETPFLFPGGALFSPDGVQPRCSPPASADVASLACRAGPQPAASTPL